MTAWTTPRTYSATGDMPDAADMNTYIRDNLLHLLENLPPVGEMIWWPAAAPPPNYLVRDGSAVSRTTYPALFAVLVKSSTVTITIASPGVITWTAHGRVADDPVKFTTTGALPTGLAPGTTYYVKTVLSANTFTLSATRGGAVINTSGSQSGVHTAIHTLYGDGDGSTTFNLPDGRGRMAIGANATYPLATVGGAATHTLTVSEMPAHAHTQPTHTHAVPYQSISLATGGNSANSLIGGFTVATDGGTGGTTGNAGSDTAFSILNPYIALTPIIRYQ